VKIIEITNVDFSLRHFLLPVMRGLRARGHEVIGVSADGPLLEVARADGFRIVPVPMARSLSPRAQLRALWALVKLFRAERPDMVHAHMPISGFLARIAARVAGVPRVAYTSHGDLYTQPGSWLRRGGGFAMEWVGARCTDIYLTVSVEQAADTRRFRLHRRAVAAGNGRDGQKFRPDAEARAKIRDELGVAAETVAVVIVSRLVRDKGYIELLAAMREVPAELWVVGGRLETDHGADLDPYFSRSGLGPRLRRLGYREDIAAILAAADIFVLPSYSEGLPMSVIEAMLCGLPVVATKIRGPREQVVDGETGFLVAPREVAPLAQALCRLAENAALRARMGAAGRARALALYEEATVVARTLDLLGA
jgi:glycosyltransferase involved in cell wall biosynthesis